MRVEIRLKYQFKPSLEHSRFMALVMRLETCKGLLIPQLIGNSGCDMLITLAVLQLSCLYSRLSSTQGEALFVRLNEIPGSELIWLLADIMERERPFVNCVCVLTDPTHDRILTTPFYTSLLYVPVFMVRVGESEDLLAPNYQTVRSLKQVRHEGCNLYLILLANGLQTARLLYFGDRHRLIDTRARFVLRYSDRLLEPHVQHLWNKLVNVIFLRRPPDSPRYELSTVPFPAQVQGELNLNTVNYWRAGHFRTGLKLFPDKTRDLKGQAVTVVTFPHIPATVKIWDNHTHQVLYQGLEIEIMKSMSEALNFEPVVYEASGMEEWGRRMLNGSYTGLLGEVMSGRAQIVLGNLQHTLYTLRLLDLSRPYMSQCLTFLTPEARTDDSWNTLVLPFMSNVWIAVLVTLSVGGFFFSTLTRFHRYLENIVHKKPIELNHPRRRWWLNKVNIRNFPHKKRGILIRREVDEEEGQFVCEGESKGERGWFVFEGLQNSVLYTYGMLMFVSLPSVPSGWAVRVLTGWWWFYCLLLVVSYRASLTAILAKPEPRVTINTIHQLVTSPVRCGGWGEPERLFFTTSFDPDIHKIGLKFETVSDVDSAIDRIASGTFAYYENQYFLLDAMTRHRSRQQPTNNTAHYSSGEKKYNLHIMSDCIISMPVSIGLERNSPLKPRVDEFIQRVVEAGLVHKWLSDVMSEARRQFHADNTEQIQALMDMSKFSGALVALGIGYLVCLLVLISEIFYWNLVVKRDPFFDKYNMSQFYFCKKFKGQ